MKNLKEKGNEDNNTKKDIKILCVLSAVSFILILLTYFFFEQLCFVILTSFIIFFNLLLNKLLSSLKYKYQRGSSSMSIIGQKMIETEFIVFNILAMALGAWIIQFTEFNLLSVSLVILFLAILFFRTVKCVRCFSERTAIKGEVIFRFYNSYYFFFIGSVAIVLAYLMYLFAMA